MRARSPVLTRQFIRLLVAGVASVVAIAITIACGSDDSSTFAQPAVDAGNETGTPTPSGDAGPLPDFRPNDGASLPVVDAGPLVFIVRDFRVYDAGDPTTNPDFENPPWGIDETGDASSGYAGDWKDLGIVDTQLGSDGKPVYKRGDAGVSLTTHGQAAFDQWYRDVPGTNVRIDVPFEVTLIDGGAREYDSNVSGQLYDPTSDAGWRGFFPIDDDGAHPSPFGNQGMPHNFSFSVEVHTVFTYVGGETLRFRGDDDVFVFIDNKLVMDLGGIHSPTDAQLEADTLGLTKGATYPLDFFWAERHVGGSNVLFQTTIALQPAVPR